MGGPIADSPQFGLFTRDLDKPRRVVERVQCAREVALFIPLLLPC
jgi:hypothetical protein